MQSSVHILLGNDELAVRYFCRRGRWATSWSQQERGRLQKALPPASFKPLNGNSFRLIRALLMEGAVAARLLPIRRRLSFGKPPAAGGRADMVRGFRILGLVLLSGGLLAAGVAPKAFAVTSGTLDILPGEGPGEAADTVDLGSVKPIARSGREAVKPAPSGNPLWAVPLSVLTATQERPIFSASRRPPQRAVIAAPVDQVIAPVAQKSTEPEHPPLALIGAVVGESDAIAVFLDRTNQKIVRLRQGESHAGWVVSSILPREVSFKKADRIEVVALKRQDGPAGVADGPAAPGLVVPTGGGINTSFAPFVPRSTPKHGESDGL
jgi:general secretion pathway protein N